MKPMMIFVLAMMTLIILMSFFDVHLGNITPTVVVPENMLGDVLYVCPAESDGWDAASEILKSIKTPLLIGVFFAVMMLLFNWGWALYQNLLKDKFNRNMFLQPWGFTKILFWAIVVLLLAVNTPNHYRRVHVRGYSGDLVLCDNNTPNTWKNVGDGRWPKAALYKNVQK
jgi:hypothetical protein